MTKQEIVNSLAEKAGLTRRQANQALDALLSTITEALKRGDKVALIGFGTFSAHRREARTGINPRTREMAKFPARTVPVFKAGRTLRERVG